MKDKSKKVSGKTSISTFLYIAALLVGLIGIALLINNILIFRNYLTQYVAQGYPAATVINELLPTQLLPGIFEPVAVYGGIASGLLGIGVINKKVTISMPQLTETEACDDVVEDTLEEKADNAQNVEVTEKVEESQNQENIEETKEI